MGVSILRDEKGAEDRSIFEGKILLYSLPPPNPSILYCSCLSFSWSISLWWEIICTVIYIEMSKLSVQGEKEGHGRCTEKLH